MQATGAILKESSYVGGDQPKKLFLILVGFAARLFGCWHSHMSRPFTRGGETYRVCIRCGARRQFNVERWKMQGPYYFSPLLNAAGTETYRIRLNTKDAAF